MNIVGLCRSGQFVRKMTQAQARYDAFAEWYEQWSSEMPPLIAAQDGCCGRDW